MWRVGPPSDTTLQMPKGLSVDHRNNLIYVADVLGRDVVVVDARNGKPLRLIGGRGNGPGEFQAPDQTAVSPAGDVVAVFDLARQVVSFFDSGGGFRSSTPVGRRLIFFSKGMVLRRDASVMVTGGMLADTGVVPGAHWFVPAVGERRATGPHAPAEAVGEARVAHLVAGGPATALGSGALVADAPTGDVWFTSPDGARRLGSGPGATPDLLRRMLVPERTPDGRSVVGIWWTFPRAVLVDTLPRGTYLVAMSNQDSAVVRFYEVRPGGAARLLGGWRAVVDFAVPYDDSSCVVIVKDAHSAGERPEVAVARVRYPF